MNALQTLELVDEIIELKQLGLTEEEVLGYIKFYKLDESIGWRRI